MKESDHMNLTKLTKDIHKNAVDHGWWDQERSFGEIIALCHSELSEALEEYRGGKPMEYTVCQTDKAPCCKSRCAHYNGQNGTCTEKLDTHKPEGIAIELADVIIRILDYCGKEGIDMEAAIKRKHAYNLTRPYKHGGKVI